MTFTKKPAKGSESDDDPIHHLCSRCQNYAAHTFQFPQGPVHLCPGCYDEQREMSPIDDKRERMLDAHPEWQKQTGETSSQYAQRMMAEMRRIHAEAKAAGKGVTRVGG